MNKPKKLSDNQALRILQLSFNEQKTNKEIAELMECSESLVWRICRPKDYKKSACRYHRARQRFFNYKSGFGLDK